MPDKTTEDGAQVPPTARVLARCAEHVLNNELHALFCFLELAKRGGENQEHLANALQAAHRCRRVGELLGQFSRGPGETTTFDLQPVCAAAVEAATAYLRNCTVVVDVGPDAKVEGDAGALKLALQAALESAAGKMRGGKVSLIHRSTAETFSLVLSCEPAAPNSERTSRPSILPARSSMPPSSAAGSSMDLYEHVVRRIMHDLRGESATTFNARGAKEVTLTWMRNPAKSRVP